MICEIAGGIAAAAKKDTVSVLGLALVSWDL